jgi:hypothetical protein
MEKCLKVIPCGTKAFFGNLEGTISSIEITFSNIIYKFGYVDRDMNYKFFWVHEKEITTEKHRKASIGFHSTMNV